jgi:hypothetical protein
MKARAHTLQCLLAALLPMAVASPLALFAAPTNQPAATPEIQQSVFIYPNTAAEGRDPFFPGSSHVYGSNPDNQSRGPSLTDLTLKSILGTPPRVFAIINNHTFAVGDDGDVTTKDGRRLHIHCVDINPKAGTATIEANGISIPLHLSGGP